MGTIAFIGAGPGAADLITVRGARLLAEAEVVLADALTDPALRALAPQAHWIDVGKRGFGRATEQTVIHALLLHHAATGARVVRLKGGDPSVFGRLEEELAAVRAAGHEAVVVPGVTAALAAAADAQQPLTRRGHGRSVALTTAMTREHDLQAGRHADTEVFYMAGKQLPGLARQLAAAGWPATTPVSVVSRAGWPDAIHSQHTLDTLAQASVLHSGRPTVVWIGAGARALPAAPAPAERPQADADKRARSSVLRTLP
ncbi:Uroporphyrinogen-III C-methyltransferase [Tepidimonas fonticaldi]|uniref:uroporphyrinogen-III C-methyltransferase n=1 Tax=Tepidimonas fonticaldi TaxID=1101373 RepID=A0A1A6DXL6_9BURK|nr:MULTISPECIES: uroporphyrinogen-III C-methyltransferase [Tepidimonas]OBS31702.1 uroporphyrinogen-III C-methyltransferase [Tepidimonas fonticaldi]TSE33454.1 Uroporphyrinogen-III C-methyltransferase [Tepidimonas fonticaldi]